MKFVVVENKRNGIIFKHTYSSFSQVRVFCSSTLPHYNPYWSMATIVTELENNGCEFSIVHENKTCVGA